MQQYIFNSTVELIHLESRQSNHCLLLGTWVLKSLLNANLYLTLITEPFLTVLWKPPEIGFT